MHFDIIIAGGGLSGTLAALSLSQIKKSDGEPLSIAIVEATKATKPSSSSKNAPSADFDARVLALSHGSMQYLKALGLSPELSGIAATIDNIHISDRGHYGKARLSAHEHDVTAVGYVIEMVQLGKTLSTSLENYTNISWYCPDKISAIEWQVDRVSVQLASEKLLSANLLLACDGGQSSCRQFAQIGARVKDYQQSAIIANVSMQKAHKNRAFERFTEQGPIALLPLLDHQSGSSEDHHYKCSIVWTLNSSQGRDIAQLNAQEFASAFEQAFGSWLGKITKVGKRTLYPLNLVLADAQIYHRTVLVGNASHTLHPIAGQGFNLGLRDVEQLTQLIAQAVNNNECYASLSLLTQYAEQRKKDHQQVIALTDSLVTLFSNQLPPLVVGRNIGLKVLNYLTPFKKAFTNKTMGY